MKSFIPILLLVISVGLFFVVVEPLRRSVSDLGGGISAYNLALSNSTFLQKTEDGLLEAYKNIKKEDKDRLEHFLPNTVDNIKFILEVERIANQYGMPIKNIKFESPVSASGQKAQADSAKSGLVISSDPKASLPYGNFSIEFDTEGSYSSFLLFMKDLEHNLRLVNVKKVSFTVPNGKSSGNSSSSLSGDQYSYSLSVETYWLK
ncbi:MAG: hypothetical protein WCK91_01660 [bacterium]